VKLENNEKSRQNSDCKKNGNIVPKGFLPVYVGKDIPTRFVIDVSVLNHPLFAELLEASVEEFGYEHQGALRIRCDVFLFERILILINSRHPAI
jgi:SAUR family protein